MATWWSLIAEVTRIEPIENSGLTNAVCLFPEGDLGSTKSELRQVKISFFGDRLICGKSYIMFGGCRLPPNDNYLDQPLFTCQYAIEYKSSELPSHRLRITGAADLTELPTINKDSSPESYEFEIRMSGYYSDPVSDPALRKAARPGMTQINNQTVFARTSDNLFKAVIGSSKTRPGSKFFIEGEYTFSYAPQQNGSYIELNHISFNTTNRTDTPIANIDPPTGDSARRRNVKPKIKGTSNTGPSSLPTTPQNTHVQGPKDYSITSPSPARMTSASMQPPPLAQPQFDPSQNFVQAQQYVPRPQNFPQQHQPVPDQYIQTPQPAGSVPAYFQVQSDPSTPYATTSIHTTPATAESSTGGLPPLPAPVYQLDDFVDIDDIPSSQALPQETVSPSELAKGKRRARENMDDEQPPTRPKRNRKRTAKAAALRFFDMEAADEADEGGIEVSENEDDGYL